MSLLEPEDDARELICRSALPVSGPPLPPSDEPPADADEYLRRVQYEALHCSQTVDAGEIEEVDLGGDEEYATHELVSRCNQLDSQGSPGIFPVSDEWRASIIVWFKQTRE